MDAFALLRKDHQSVAALLRKIGQTTDRAQKMREELFLTLKQELEAHARVEEEVLYPALARRAEFTSRVADAAAEHEAMMDLLAELDAMPVVDERWIGTFEQLEECVLHHLQEEEGALFRDAKKLLDPGQIERLTGDLIEARARALRA